ncbi:non-ribosomal peptide synthetase [Acidisphaera sp. S103]|uniref:non-ribosomal peptide synthetase n=1 Tax=Acidisphaera sp. S103 TaxID=1747223 RepID=UPI00131BF52D|nr:non-ribosomal peptide synthetase [Acidisphaera sp. S103]
MSAATEDRRALLSRLLREKAVGGIPLAPRTGPLPLSFAQRRIWFLDHLGHTGSGYVIPLVATLEGPLDPTALRAALEAVVRRHAVLRTRFVERGGEPLQEEGPAYAVPLDCNDADPEAAMAAATAFTATAIPLAEGRMLRARLWRTGTERHVLAIAVHHIAFDGWSVDVLGRDLAALYPACLAGLESPLPPLPVQYADFAVWQRSPARLAAQQARLAERAARIAALPAFKLRGDRVPPAGRPRQGRIQRFALTPELSVRLLALGQAQGVTPFTLLLTGFLLLLARHEQAAHPLVGCPIAGRDGAATEDLLGFFVNSLVIDADFSGKPSFVESLTRVRRSVTEAMAAQDIPFEQVVERAQPDRLLARNPVFEVMFAWQAPFRLPDLSPSLRVGALTTTETTARFDLECHAWRDGDQILGGLIYDADRFDADRMALLADHFTALLESAVAAPSAPAMRLGLGDGSYTAPLPAASWPSMPSVPPSVSWPGLPRPPKTLPGSPPQDVDGWAKPGHDTGRDTSGRTVMPTAPTLPDLFALALRRDPGAVAVVDGGTTLSFVALDRRANALALRLRGLGVTAETPVAMCLARSAASVIATLAVAKAGGALLPLDPAWPAARRQAAMAAASAHLILDDAALADQTEASVGPVADGLGPERLAYLAFTSGSTGVPKCIAVQQSAVAHLVLDTDYVRIEPGDRVAHLASPAFDAATFEIWGPLLNGGTILVIGRSAVLEPGALATALRDGDVSVAFVTTALLHRVAEDAPDGFAGLRTLLFGGEACDPALVRRILIAGPPGRLLHVYGPTETTTFASWHNVTAVAENAVTIPIGGPIRGAELHIVETGDLETPAPFGIPGALLIAGTGMARGYIGAPGLTADRFRPDPWGPPGARLYRTGDVACRRLDGSVEFLGRVDRQVKIRGFRIEPAEVETALRRHPGVADAAVAVEDGLAGRRLVAYAVPRAATDADGRVADWAAVFDERIYGKTGTSADPLFDTAGWRNTATGEPIAEPVMRAWATEIVDHTLAGSPRRVLEIGHGTGMLLFSIAPRVEAYIGCEISKTAQASVQTQLDRLGWTNVRLEQRAADDLEGMPDDFDCVLLSSVVQYFPDAAYLVRVLRGALARVRPGGRVVLADLRNLRRRDLFHIDFALARSTPADAVLAEAEAGIRADAELHLDPAFFAALAGQMPEISEVAVSAQLFEADNELTRYRYTVVLTRSGGPAAADRSPDVWHRGEGLDAGAIAAMLRNGTPVGFRGLADAWLAGLARTVAGLRGAARPGAAGVGFTPASLRRLAPPGWQVAVAHGEGTTLDALFRFGVEAALIPMQPIAADPLTLASIPAAPLATWDAAELRVHLAALLPDWMLPAAIHRVPGLPLTSAGKLDMRALAASVTASAPVGMRSLTPTEDVVAEFYRDLLGAPRVGADDDFFALGGHSLLASRLVSRLRDRFDMRLALDAVFRTPTVAGLAGEIDALRAGREEGEI